MRDAPLPDLVLYARPGCGLCDEARGLLDAMLDERARAGLAPRGRRARHRDRPAWERAYFERSRSSSSASDAWSSPRAPPSCGGSWPTSWTPDRADGRHRPDDPRRARGRRDQLPVAVRAAARAGLPRPADRGRRRGLGRGASRRAGSRSATRSRTWPGSAPSSRSSASRRRSPPARWSTTCRRCASSAGVVLIVLGLDLAGLLRIPASSGPGGRSTPARPGRWRRRPADCARRRSAGTRASATGSAGTSSARAAAGSRRSGSGRSSRSAGARASGSSSAAS